MRTFRAIALALVVAAAPGASPAEPATADGAALKEAIAAIRGDDWKAAKAAFATIGDPVARDIQLWFRLADGRGRFEEYRAFLATHADWPRLDRIRRRAERAIPAEAPPRMVLDFFANTAPVTGTGATHLARALRQTGQADVAREVLAAAWRDVAMSPGEQAKFVAAHRETIRRWSAARAETMLWAGALDQAERVLPYLPAERAALVRARLALQRGKRGVDALIKAVPESLADDPGLAHDRFEWRVRHGRWQDAMALIIERSTSAEALGQPEAWAKRRLQLAHRAMREGDARRAYRIAAQHWLQRGADFEQLEWFAGWVALRKLGDARLALRHFQTFRAHVDTPISKGRAGYWLGRAHEALGQEKRAREAYSFAARYQTSFYGQLAAERAGIAPDRALAGPKQLPDWRHHPVARSSLVRAVLLFDQADEPGRVWQFLVHKARLSHDPRELEALASLALSLDRPNVAVRVAKIAAARETILMAAYYPVTPLARAVSTGLVAELVMALARQESEFNVAAISHAGARGIMQLMPATARKVARALGLKYSRAALTDDWRYNAVLGQAYLAARLEEFGSPVLAAAAYNAGPERAAAWLERYGDPRRNLDAAIDWIETIPFAETRNYVMRVLEGMHVYRARLGGRVQPLRIGKDIRGLK